MYDTRLIIFLAIFNIFLPTVVFAAPIHQAAKTGNLDAIKIIVAQSADKTKTINENSHDGREPVQNSGKPDSGFEDVPIQMLYQCPDLRRHGQCGEGRYGEVITRHAFVRWREIEVGQRYPEAEHHLPTIVPVERRPCPIGLLIEYFAFQAHFFADFARERGVKILAVFQPSSWEVPDAVVFLYQ